jgi:NADPH2:quinone reductase
MTYSGRAVFIRQEELVIDSYEASKPGPGQVLVSVMAAGINRADLLQRRGLYPAPPGVVSDIPGLEYAGEILAVGEGAERAVGERVMGIVAGGAMSTHLVVPANELLSIPVVLSFEEAAAIPEAFLTALDAFDQVALSPGETVLIHAVASGVGTAAMQLAQARGATVVGTSRSLDKLTKCQGLGLEHGVHVTDNAFSALVKERCPSGVDVVVDLVGAVYLEENFRCLAQRGRMIVLGLLGGATASIPLSKLLAKRLAIYGSILRSRNALEKTALAQKARRDLLPLLEAGTVRPVVDRILPFEQVNAAHAALERGECVGKVVLHW